MLSNRKVGTRLLLVLLCLITAAVSHAMAESYVMAGFDGLEATHDWATNGFFERMEKKTGISFTFQSYNDYSKWSEAKSDMLSGAAALPDVLFKAALTTDEILQGLDSGKLIDLSGLLEEYAPNLWKLLEENPDWKAAVTLPDGRIGALPTLNRMGTQNAMWINGEWLEKLGLSMPEDWDDLEEVLLAFRDKDPNGNGKKDEIPMSFLGAWDLKFLSHAFGVVTNDYNVWRDEMGELHYFPLEEGFLQLAEKLKGFYDRGLLDQNGFSTTDTIRTVTDSEADAVYGIFFSPTPLNLLPASQAEKYILVLPLSFEGKRVYRDMGQDVIGGSFAITSACKDPAALLAWVDYLYTREGAVLAMVGEENVDYTVNEEGNWNYEGSISYTRMSTLSVFDTGAMPWLFPDEFYAHYDSEGVQKICSELQKLTRYLKLPVRRVLWTGEDRVRLASLQSSLGACVDTTFARWIMGDLPFNEETIEEFRSSLLEKGAEEMLSLWEKALMQDGTEP